MSDELKEALEQADKVADIVREGRHEHARCRHQEGAMVYWITADSQPCPRDQRNSETSIVVG